MGYKCYQIELLLPVIYFFQIKMDFRFCYLHTRLKIDTHARNIQTNSIFY